MNPSAEIASYHRSLRAENNFPSVRDELNKMSQLHLVKELLRAKLDADMEVNLHPHFLDIVKGLASLSYMIDDFNIIGITQAEAGIDFSDRKLEFPIHNFEAVKTVTKAAGAPTISYSGGTHTRLLEHAIAGISNTASAYARSPVAVQARFGDCDKEASFFPKNEGRCITLINDHLFALEDIKKQCSDLLSDIQSSEFRHCCQIGMSVESCGLLICY